MFRNCLKSFYFIIVSFFVLSLISCPNDQMRDLVELKVSDPVADTFIINSGAPTSSRTVTLNSNVSKEEDALEMRFKMTGAAGLTGNHILQQKHGLFQETELKPMIGDILYHYRNREIAPQWDRQTTDEVMKKLYQVPFFVNGYEEDGFAIEQFNEITSLKENAALFAQATNDMIDFVGKFV